MKSSPPRPFDSAEGGGNDLFANAFEYAAIGMALVAPDGRWIRVNRAVCEILGYREEELLAKNFQEFTHPDDLKQDLGLVGEMLAGTRSSYQMEKRYLHKSGSVVWAILSVSLLRDQDLQPLNFISQIQDITELKRSEIRRERFFELSLDIMAIAGFDGYFRQVNPAWTRILGWSQEELMGSLVLDFVHPEDRAATQAAQLSLTAGKPLQSLENRYRCKDGSYRWLSWRSVGLEDEKVVYAVARDISDQKEWEAELRRAREAAEAVSRAKSEFLAMTSHEIRTPMNSVIGFCDLLQSTALTPEQDEFVASIQKSGGSLMEIINQILDFSKMEAGMYQIHPQPMNFPALINEIHAALSPLAQARGLDFTRRLSSEVPDWIDADATAIKRVLINLVGNAIKFTERGSVEFEVEKRQEGGGPVLWVRVRDTGIGLTEETLALLFQPFVQGDPSDARKFGGTGLGLAISQHLATAMGGRIHAELRSDEPGAIFHFWFPLIETLTVSPQLPPLYHEVVSPDLRILLVEDNILNQKLMVLLLQRLGSPCTVVGDGHQALAILEHEHFDIILMDVQMPGLDGWEATREIRRRETGPPHWKRHYIIGQTAYATADDADRCRRVDMDAHLPKPITLASLAAVLAKAAQIAGPKN